jgi:hypothetical protein
MAIRESWNSLQSLLLIAAQETKAICYTLGLSYTWTLGDLAKTKRIRIPTYLGTVLPEASTCSRRNRLSGLLKITLAHDPDFASDNLKFVFRAVLDLSEADSLFPVPGSVRVGEPVAYIAVLDKIAIRQGYTLLFSCAFIIEIKPGIFFVIKENVPRKP